MMQSDLFMMLGSDDFMQLPPESGSLYSELCRLINAFLASLESFGHPVFIINYLCVKLKFPAVVTHTETWGVLIAVHPEIAVLLAAVAQLH